YAIYLMGFFIVGGYYFLKKVYESKKVKVNPITMIIIVVITFFGLTQIKQVSSWAVFLFVSSLFVFYNAKNLKGLLYVGCLLAVVLPFFAQELYDWQIKPLINKEIAVGEGDAPITNLGNGRMGRWVRYFEIWDQMPALS